MAKKTGAVPQADDPMEFLEGQPTEPLECVGKKLHILGYGGIWPYPGYAYSGYGRQTPGYVHLYPGIWSYLGYVYPGYTTFFRRSLLCSIGVLLQLVLLNGPTS